MGTTNRKPPGPIIIMIDQSKTGRVAVRSYLLHSSLAGAQLCCAFYQPQQTESNICSLGTHFFWTSALHTPSVNCQFVTLHIKIGWRNYKDGNFFIQKGMKFRLGFGETNEKKGSSKKPNLKEKILRLCF